MTNEELNKRMMQDEAVYYEDKPYLINAIIKRKVRQGFPGTYVQVELQDIKAPSVIIASPEQVQPRAKMTIDAKADWDYLQDKNLSIVKR